MPTLTLSIPVELKQEMDGHPELNWSEIARRSIKEKLELLKRMDKLLEKSTLTEEDAIRIGRKINKAAAKKFFAKLAIQ